MNLFVGVTDNDWFEFLASAPRDEVNFWSPSGIGFDSLKPGELFLFKLHSPLNFIVGGGFFLRHSQLPLSLAWEAFGEKNGAPDIETCRQRVAKYKKTTSFEPDPLIGCSILSEPFFLSKPDWIPVPSSFSLNIVRGKRYEAGHEDTESLLLQLQHRLYAEAQPQIVAEKRFGNAYLTLPRLGQGGFRVLVTEAYERRCAMTGERTLPVLQAAHIKPYSLEGPHAVRNGLLLRSDLHTLFDCGLMTVKPDLTISVSTRIRDTYQNGRAYYALEGQTIRRPNNPNDVPDKSFLEWHNDSVFRA